MSYKKLICINGREERNVLFLVHDWWVLFLVSIRLFFVLFCNFFIKKITHTRTHATCTLDKSVLQSDWNTGSFWRSRNALRLYSDKSIIACPTPNMKRLRNVHRVDDECRKRIQLPRHRCHPFRVYAHVYNAEGSLHYSIMLHLIVALERSADKVDFVAQQTPDRSGFPTEHTGVST